MLSLHAAITALFGTPAIVLHKWWGVLYTFLLMIFIGSTGFMSHWWGF